MFAIFWVLFPLATRVWAWDETWAELGKKRGKDMLLGWMKAKKKRDDQREGMRVRCRLPLLVILTVHKTN
jgi:hypothetical protein